MVGGWTYPLERAWQGGQAAYSRVGQVVEEASVYDLFRRPLHPYTRGLMNSTIKVHQSEEKLDTIVGTVPSLADMPAGCRFNPRCPFATAACRDKEPPLAEVLPGRKVRCIRWNELGGEGHGEQ